MVLIGSHSDTQPEGGWLDGSYGIICGLEIARAAQEAGLKGIAMVSFADEEGTFEPLLGSRVWSGDLPFSAVQDRTDRNGRRLRDVLAGMPELRAADIGSPNRRGVTFLLCRPADISIWQPHASNQVEMSLVA